MNTRAGFTPNVAIYFTPDPFTPSTLLFHECFAFCGSNIDSRRGSFLPFFFYYVLRILARYVARTAFLRGVATFSDCWDRVRSYASTQCKEKNPAEGKVCRAARRWSFRPYPIPRYVHHRCERKKSSEVDSAPLDTILCLSTCCKRRLVTSSRHTETRKSRRGTRRSWFRLLCPLAADSFAPAAAHRATPCSFISVRSIGGFSLLETLAYLAFPAVLNRNTFSLTRSIFPCRPVPFLAAGRVIIRGKIGSHKRTTFSLAVQSYCFMIYNHVNVYTVYF